MRISCDLDNPSYLKVLTSYYNLWFITKKKPQIRKSASGKGFHIRVFGSKLPVEEILQIRESLGDDELRIRFDREKESEPFDVLFSMKNGKYATEWTDDIERVL